MRIAALVLGGFLGGAALTYGAWQAFSPVDAQIASNPPAPALASTPATVTTTGSGATDSATRSATVSAVVPSSRPQIDLSFAPVVRQAAPAVASIYTRRIVEQQQSPFGNDPLFGQLFGAGGPSVPRVQNALGSGVILSSDGVIVSNYHVVGGASDIRVVLNDRREFTADVLLADQESDLAVLKLRDAHDLPALSLANSDQVQVGDLVLAIGNPFGVGQTVSSGIVSALARSALSVGSGRGYFIQTDAAINPGNSGGALVDMRGHVVGINSAILTRSGGSNGIGFAIPANLVAQIVAQARAGQTVFQRPWLGISGQAVDAGLAEGFGMDLPQGVVITALQDASPLAAAGLRAGDVVLAVDGEPVNSPQEMMFRLAARGIGGTATLTTLHGEARTDVQVALVAAPEDPPRNRLTVRDLVLRGLVAETINPAVIAEHGLAPDAKGVLVVEATDIAAQAGLQPGDIVVSVNRQPIRDTAELARALRDRARYWEIGFSRNGQLSWLRFRV